MLPQTRIFVGFFGITRSLKFTVDSILSNILEPLKKIGAPIIQVAHFNLPPQISNPRSGEVDVPVDSLEYKLLDLDCVIMETQDDRLIRSRLHIAKKFPDHFEDGYRSITNLCHQLRSLERLWSIIKTFRPTENDVIVLTRPDLLIMDPVEPERDVAPLQCSAVDIVVPAWHCWGGLNDRLAFCSTAAAERYAVRGRYVQETCAEIGALHPETLLACAMSKASLKVAFTPLRALRMRADGVIAPLDVEMFS